MNYYEDEVSKNTRFPEDFLIVTPFTKKNPLVEALLLRLNIFWKIKFMEDENHMTQWKNKLRDIKNNNTSITEKDNDNIERIITLSNEDYNKYAIFHKSEDGSSIDLSESDYATRIVSCHTSKGDGRKVVFIIGFNESSIKKFSQISNNLIYDSLLHVAITRMKEKLYIYFIDNGDDISYIIGKFVIGSWNAEREHPGGVNTNTSSGEQDLVYPKNSKKD
jgi:superfamily I DNA/RNA helicase